MAYITRGYTLTDGLANNYNYTTLHALVDSATVTAIAFSELSTLAHTIQVSASVPVSDQGDGSLWYDSTLGIMRTKNGNASWDCQYIGPEMQNTTGSTLPKGALVVATGERTIAMCNTGMWPEAIGVLTATLTNNSKGIVRSKGIGQALVVGPTTIGNTLISAGHGVFAFADGYMRSVVSTGMSNVTLGVAVGVVWAQVASGVTALATCSIWR